jgi:hypothetical protein
MPAQDLARSVDRGLGGKGAEEYRPVEGGLGIGLGQPGMERHHGGIEAEADHDQPGVEFGMGDIHQVKGDIAHRLIAEQDTRPEE